MKSWSITFPQTDMDRDVFAESFPPWEEVICSREAHKDEGFHLHLGIKLMKGITKRNMLKWIEKKYPDDYKRIDVQCTRSIKDWSEYISKEDPECFRAVNSSARERADIKLYEKVQELARKCENVYMLPTRIEGFLELQKFNAEKCKGCKTVCQECETRWREFWKKNGDGPNV